MGVLKSLFRWYILGSLHVSLALISFLAYTTAITGVDLSPAYTGLLFFSSVAGYNAIKFGAEPWKRKTLPRSSIRIILSLSMISIGAASVFALMLPWEIILLVALGAGVAALYALPVLPGFRNFRSFGMIKVLLVALVWVHLTVWIPLWDYSPFEQWDMIIESLQRFLWVCLLMLPFEIRDMKADPVELRTWPRRWGLPATRSIGWMGAFAFVMMTFMKDSFYPPEFWSKMVAAVFMGWAIRRCSFKPNSYFVAFWVEAVPIWTYLLWRVLRTWWWV